MIHDFRVKDLTEQAEQAIKRAEIAEARVTELEEGYAAYQKIAEARVAEFEKKEARLSVLLFTTEQASPEDLPPCGVDNVTLAEQHYDAVLKISDRLAEHFGDENEHLGQPYGNVYDAIYDALGRLIDQSGEGG